MSSTFFSNALAALILATLSAACPAVIIKGAFEGHITQMQDVADSISGNRDIWEGDITGQTFTGNFWYDTGLAPADNWSEPNKAIYFSRSNNWVGLEFLIDGKLFSISKQPAGSEITEAINLVTIDDHEVAVDGDSNEIFSVSDEVLVGDETAEFDYKTGFVSMLESAHDLLQGTDLEQNFTWVNDAANPAAGGAYFSITGRMNGQYYFADAIMTIDRMTVTRSTSIPEPSPVILLISSLFIIASRPLLSHSFNLIKRASFEVRFFYGQEGQE